ncbi:ABC transporter substrate-binding protein [Sneathiella chinensis]|uniref:Binding-protein-dependent transporter n=1 Tax=Sneathiella chinensis TaxID=349750 RepID=A0ABQ5U649_9PROT|nr:ABC transporter substrate-binding protein [Sneathiella chinensis]GLQ07373.1 binding-protein-dependent transporter [Sneathiella chinensis]
MLYRVGNIAVAGLALGLAYLPTTTPAQAENILRFANMGDAATLDPYALNSQVTLLAGIQMHDALVMRDPEMKKVPGLATSWESIDPLTWQFNLRKDVKFHNGNAFTADDVIFSIKRAQAETSQMKGYLNTITEVRKLDDHTVQLVTDKPNPILLDQLINIFMMDKEWSEEHNVTEPQNFKDNQETYAVRHTNGTGAFKLESREPDVKTVLVRNPDWWGNEIYKHNIDKVVWTPIANDATRVAALLSGEVDLLTDPPIQDLNRLGRHDALKVEKTPQIRTIFYGFDVRSEELRNSSVKGTNPFKDVRVRKAFYHAIDIEAIKRAVMRGLSAPAGMVIEPPINGYRAEWDKNRLPYSPEKGKELLAEAGYPQGFEVQLDCPNNRYQNDEAICQATVGMLQKIGIKANLNSQPKTQHFPLITGKGTDFYLLGWGIPTMDSGFIFDYLMHSDGSWNAGGYGTPELDAKIEAIRGIVDAEKRNQMIHEIWTQIQADVPYLPLHHQMIAWAMKKGLDIPIEPNNMPRFYWAKLDG